MSDAIKVRLVVQYRYDGRSSKWSDYEEHPLTEQEAAVNSAKRLLVGNRSVERGSRRLLVRIARRITEPYITVTDDDA